MSGDASRRWEYRIVELGGGGFFDGGEGPSEEELNELGDDGWELVATLTSGEHGFGGRGSRTSALVFKRPKR
jgi:hypothetical protein